MFLFIDKSKVNGTLALREPKLGAEKARFLGSLVEIANSEPVTDASITLKTYIPKFMTKASWEVV